MTSKSKIPPQFKFVPLGGVGEIGSNMALIHDDHQGFIIDMGILFPNDDFFGIDYLVPDISQYAYLTINHVIFTHGHEDHIGAIKFFAQILPEFTIWASPFSASLIRHKMREEKYTPKINIFNPYEQIELEQFIVTPIPLNHSIPETFGLYIRDAHFTHGLFYASDFKIDLTPQFEQGFDIDKLAKQLSQCQTRSLFIDSTNILNDGKTLSEQDLIHDLKFIFETNSHKRIFVTLFASNIWRMRNIFTIAKQLKLPITVIGKSIHRYIQAAIETDLFPFSTTDYFDINDNPSPNENGIFIVSGCQGDFLSAFRRLCLDEIKNLKLNENDLFLYSSKVIPGNEKKVYKLFNHLAEKGVEIITDREFTVHASGHPGKEDLSYFLNKLNLSANYFPIHGETLFLKKHYQFISRSFPQLTPHYISNHHSISFIGDGSIKLENHEPLPPLIIHGKNLVLERESISERRKLATLGLSTINVDLKKCSIEIINIGLPAVTDEYSTTLKAELEKIVKNNLNADVSSIEETIRIRSRKFFELKLGYRPIVISKVFHHG